MIAVWIVAGILLALFLLLLCPVTIVVGFQKEFTIKIRYLFFTYQVAPPKEKPKKEAKEFPESEKKEPEEHKKSKFQKILEEKGISGLLKLLRQVGEVATRTARRLFSHLVVTRLHLEILVADEDAAQAAVNYGYVCGIVCTALSAFLHNCICKRYHVQITPDFDQKESSAVLDFQAHIRLLFLISGVLGALMHLVQLQKEGGQAVQSIS